MSKKPVKDNIFALPGATLKEDEAAERNDFLIKTLQETLLAAQEGNVLGLAGAFMMANGEIQVVNALGSDDDVYAMMGGLQICSNLLHATYIQFDDVDDEDEELY